MSQLKQLFTLFVVSVLLSACGGADNGYSGSTPVQGIVGSWLSPCTTITSGPSQTHFQKTVSFNADGTLYLVDKSYQERTCENLNTTGTIKETFGTYKTGGEITASDGKSATELDITYSETKIDGESIDVYLDNVALIVYRIESNKFYTGTLRAEGHFSTTRRNSINEFYPYTLQ